MNENDAAWVIQVIGLSAKLRKAWDDKAGITLSAEEVKLLVSMMKTILAGPVK